MKRKILSLLMIGFGLFLSIACQGPDDKLELPEETEPIWLSYQETQCHNPWTYSNSQQDKEQFIKTYLEKLGIKVLNISITKEADHATCMDCICRTGKVIKVQVNKKYEAQLLYLGFVVL